MKITEMVKAYGGMVFGKKDYWHPDMAANMEIRTDAIGCYYVDMRPKCIYTGKFDDADIPLLEFDGRLCYFPVTIAQYGLGNFDKYMDTKDEKYFAVCENCAEWLEDNISEIKPGLYGYINDYDKVIYNLKSPWLSSLSQGQALSLLSRCYSINGNVKYLDICKKLLCSFEYRTSNGGVLDFLNGESFYEEYPSDRPSFVLNGFIFSLWGILDYYIVSGDPAALKLYDAGKSSLERNIDLYNIRSLNWSRYDLYPFKIIDIASIFYHKLHIEQLKAMYLLTGNEVYKSMYLKWEKAKDNRIIYSAATIYKIVHKLSMRNESNYVPSIGKEK